MTVFIDGKKADEAALAALPVASAICLVQNDGTGLASTLPGAGDIGRLRVEESFATRYESHLGYDYLSVLVPDLADVEAEPKHVEMWFDGSRLTVVHDGLAAVQAVEKMLEGGMPAHPEDPQCLPQQAMLAFFMHLTAKDTQALATIEDTIAGLEEELVNRTPSNGLASITLLRRSLLVLKRYYEGLFNLLEDLEENANGFYSKGQLRAFRQQTNRADRLLRAVVNLRDFVAQVREAYQNQLDLGMNKVMQFFTAVTTIFLPLSLVATWYGMNLMMPEYDAPLAYPFIILLSLVFSIVCIWYFRKKKWF